MELGRCRVPFAIENPLSSFMWKAPVFHRALERLGVEWVKVDMCAFGERYKKPTLLAMVNCADLGVLGIPAQSRCSGKHGVCAFTRRPHVWLEGASTTRAARYPSRLAAALAKSILSSRAPLGGA